MAQRFAYFYFMANDPSRVGTTAPVHAAYWRDLQPADNEAGLHPALPAGPGAVAEV